MPAPENIHHLVMRFEDQLNSFRSSRYNETQLRREFLDPFFEALGWDVLNKQGYAEAYKDVVHEDSVVVEGATKAPDYAFRIGGQRKFFVEAKKPSVNIQSDIHPAYQLRRYAWSAKLPLGVLTDFEELAIYDCRSKPDNKDKASTGRVALYSFHDYLEKWGEIADILSREAVLKGSFDKYAEGLKGKKGTAEVDDAFLAEIESWRELLSKNFALRNPSLTTRELNYAVQMTIDRIIFLRICEDRGIEPYEKLRGLLAKENVYESLCHTFRQADDRYNSGLFHFRDEKNSSSAADSLTLGLSVDDKVLRDILGSLYYPESPYVFSEIPSDILGQVYERFLGKVIRLTAGHQAKVEEKPEVRKAGGVYYTPTYIVEYIVKNTVGKLVDGKTPNEVAKLRILDPACGSGTFPIGAYQYLLDWHRAWYSQNDPQKLAKSKKPPIFQGKDGWQLTLGKKKEILLNNIFGVDIDPQAVEVTKLSLLLKLVEAPGQLDFMGERILPDLGANIKCGNSLIGPDYYDGKMFVDEEERYRVNAFDWQAEFPQVFIQGGFDAVVGNPPWAFTKYVDWGDETKTYIQQKYLSPNIGEMQSRSRQAGKINLFAIFVLLGIDVLTPKGLFSFIIPNNILRTTVYDIVRRQLLENTSIMRIVDLKAGVFEGVTASTIVILLENRSPSNTHLIDIVDNSSQGSVDEKIANTINQRECLANTSYVIDIFGDSRLRAFLQRIDRVSAPLGELVDVLNGIATEKNMAGILDEPKDKNSKPILFGKDIGRYTYRYSGKYVDYVRERLLRARDESLFLASEKLIMQRIGGILITAFDDQQYYTFNSVNNLLPKSGVVYNLKYILGVLNSKLLRFYYISRFTNKSSLTVNISKTFLDQLPICRIDFSNGIEKMRHEKMVSLVERMLELHKQTPRSPQDKERVRREIETTDRTIDLLVYELYGLTEDEIKIVNGEE